MATVLMHPNRITSSIDSPPSPPKTRFRFLSLFRRRRSTTTTATSSPSPSTSATHPSMGAHQSTHCPFTGRERRRRGSTHSPSNTKSVHHERHATAAHLTDKVFSRDAVKAFEKSELSMLDGLFREISFPHSVSGSKKEVPVLDKMAFLRLFKVPGLLGERLFAVFDTKHQGVIDYDEFIAGLATYCRGSTEDKLKMLFDMYDVTGTGAVSREELKTMLYSLITPAHYFFQPQSTSPMPQSGKSSTPTPEPQRDTSMHSSSASSSNSSSEHSTTPMEIHASPSADSSPGILARRIAARIADRSEHGPTSHPSHHSDDTFHVDDRNDWNSLDREFRSLKVMDDHQLVESIVQDAFDTCDTSKDGKLQFDEFVEFIRQTPTVVEALEKAFVFQYWNDHHTQQRSRKSPAHSPKQHSRNASLTVPPIHSLRKSMTLEGISSSTDRPNVSRSISHNGLTPPSHPIPTSRSFTSLHDIKPRSLQHSVSLNHTVSTPTIYCRDCGFQLRFCHGCGSTLVIQSLSNITCTSAKCHMTSNDYQHCTQCGHQLEETSADLPLVQSPVATTTISSSSPRTNTIPPMANTLAASADDIINENLYHSGIIYKQGKYLKRWKQRWSVLRHNILYIFQDSTELRCSAALFMESQFVDIPSTDDHAKEGYYAIVLTNMRTKIARTLYLKSQQERMEWVTILKKAAKSTGVESRYELGKQIGKGKFSTVVEAKQIESGDMYAVKVIDKSRVCSDPMELEALRTEIAILRLIDHPYVVKMREMFVSKSHLYLVMDLLRGGDLFDRLIQRGHFSEQTTRLIIHKLLLAIQYLHARGIVHRDLKPENILCISEDDDSHVMIADFGLSKFATPSEVMNLPCGTLAYVAPEVLKLQGYGKSVDLWSIGIIGFLLLSGILPFDGSTKAQIIERTLHAKIHFDAPVFKDVSDEAKDVIGRLLHKNPAQRMTVDEALSHKWFADLKKKSSPRAQPLSAPSQPTITITQA